MSNRRNIQFLYNPHNKATLLDCSFIVDHANGNGLGIRSLKGSGRIASVFMQSTSPASTNPLVASGTGSSAGLIVVNLQDNYNRYLGGFSGFVSPVTGGPLTSGLTVGNAYVIVSLGSSTRAQWTSAGLPSYITPAVGASFIAKATSIAGGGSVEAVAASGIDHIEVIGDANQMNNNGAYNLSSGGGMQIILGCYLNSTLTAPTDQTVIGLSFYMNDSAQGV